MSILTIIFQTQVHLHADLVYLFISITGIVATPIHSTTFLVNKLKTPIYTHMLRLANNENINLATNICTGLCSQLGKRVAVSMTSLVLKLNLWILTNNH